MDGLKDLPAEHRKRLCDAFADARHQWGPRARFARETAVDASTVQALEGRRPSNVTADMIDRVTAGVGWPRGLWRLIASGEIESPGVVRPGSALDQTFDMSGISMSALLGEVARRLAASDPSS